MKKKKLRPLGEVTHDLEKILFEMCHDHQMQEFEIMGITNHWIRTHYPSAIPVYEEDGTHPIYFYGHEWLFKQIGKAMK